MAVNRAVEATRAKNNTKMEALVKAQAKKLAELEATCAGLKQEENLTVGYRRLSDKHKALVAKAEQEKI
jgi:exonuclease VII large subunit